MTRLPFLVLPACLIAGIAMAETQNPAPATPPHARQTVAQALAGRASETKTARAADRATKALNLLEANGDNDFTNFRVDGRDFAATVKKPGGESFNVRIDPDTNMVVRTS